MESRLAGASEPATVREVHEALGKDSGYTTTLKQMQLMTDKGFVTRSERFRSHVYEAAEPKEQTQQQIAGHLGTSREVIARLIGRIAARGYIVSGRKAVTILQPAMLARLGK